MILLSSFTRSPTVMLRHVQKLFRDMNESGVNVLPRKTAEFSQFYAQLCISVIFGCLSFSSPDLVAFKTTISITVYFELVNLAAYEQQMN